MQQATLPDSDTARGARDRGKLFERQVSHSHRTSVRLRHLGELPHFVQLLVSRLAGHVVDPRGIKSHLDGEPVSQDLA